MSSCTSFRARLQQALRGRVRPGGELWHEHVLSCPACRELLASEEALEALLASLPEPRLPVALAQRVLARLEEARPEVAQAETGEAADALDVLLDLDAAPAAPEDLPERVLDRLDGARRAAAEHAALDRLLDAQPAPRVPAGLARRTLDALESERGRRPRLTLVSFGRMATLAAAAVVLLATGVLLWRLLNHEDPARIDEHVAQAPGAGDGDPGAAPKDPGAAPKDPGAAPKDPATDLRDPVTPVQPLTPDTMPAGPSDELLAALDVLENWDLLVSEDLDLQLASMDPLEREFADLLQSASEDEASLVDEEDEQG